MNVCGQLLVMVLSFLIMNVDPSGPQRLSNTITLFLTMVAFKLVIKQSLPTISYLTYLVSLSAWHSLWYLPCVSCLPTVVVKQSLSTISYLNYLVSHSPPVSIVPSRVRYLTCPPCVSLTLCLTAYQFQSLPKIIIIYPCAKSCPERLL